MVIDSIPIVPYTQTMTVQPGPMVPVIQVQGNDTICEGQQVALTAQTSAGATIQWLKDNSPIPNAVGDTLIVDQSGTYTARAVNPGGCSPNSLPQTIHVSPSSSPGSECDKGEFLFRRLHSTTNHGFAPGGHLPVRMVPGQQISSRLHRAVNPATLTYGPQTEAIIRSWLRMNMGVPGAVLPLP